MVRKFCKGPGLWIACVVATLAAHACALEGDMRTAPPAPAQPQHRHT